MAQIAEATGLDADRFARGKGILPATRFAVNEYLNIVRSRTSIGSGRLVADRIVFPRLISCAWKSCASTIPGSRAGWIISKRFNSSARRCEVCGELRLRKCEVAGRTGPRDSGPARKCDILWAQLDALYFAYVQPGWPPPGAFKSRRASMSREAMEESFIPTRSAGKQ